MSTQSPPPAMKVPLLDLTRQYEKIAAEVQAAIGRVCGSQHFILGTEVRELERRLALTEPERQAVLFAAAAELCATTAALVGKIGAGPPSVSLAMRVCDGLDWQALRPDGALRRAPLLALGAPDVRFTERPL